MVATLLFGLGWQAWDGPTVGPVGRNHHSRLLSGHVTAIVSDGQVRVTRISRRSALVSERWAAAA